MEELDWRWLASFVDVVEHGGLSRAAAQTSRSQPTLSRHIHYLEQALGVVLFDREGRELVLSRQGLELLEHAMDVKRSVKAFEQHAVGVGTQRTGSVRVTMSDMFGFYFAPNWLVAFNQSSPHITVDLVLEDQAVNPMMREAEVALRRFEPVQQGLLIKYCGRTSQGFYASPGFVSRFGEPHDLDGLTSMPVIGQDRLMTWVEYAQRLGMTYAREDFVMRTDTMVMHVRAAQAGLGWATVPNWVARQTDLVRVLPHITMPGQPIYLTAAPDTRRNPLVTELWEHLVGQVTAMCVDSTL